MSRTTRVRRRTTRCPASFDTPTAAAAGSTSVAYDPATDSIDDTAPRIRRSAVSVPPPSGVGTCVTDLQLQHELDRVIQAHDPAGRGLHDVWFGVLGAERRRVRIRRRRAATNAFAGYHSPLERRPWPGQSTRRSPSPLVEFNPPPGSDPQGNPKRNPPSTSLPTKPSRRSPTRRAWAGWTPTALRSQTSVRTARRSGPRSATRPMALPTTR